MANKKNKKQKKHAQCLANKKKRRDAKRRKRQKWQPARSSQVDKNPSRPRLLPVI
jgi:hypothetical protein